MKRSMLWSMLLSSWSFGFRVTIGKLDCCALINSLLNISPSVCRMCPLFSMLSKRNCVKCS